MGDIRLEPGKSDIRIHAAHHSSTLPHLSGPHLLPGVQITLYFNHYSKYLSLKLSSICELLNVTSKETCLIHLFRTLHSAQNKQRFYKSLLNDFMNISVLQET